MQGCNYFRLALHPHIETIIRLGDKMDLMVWEEIPVYWTIDFVNLKTYKNSENKITTTITGDQNRACVII